jgi:hypothetical protein
MIRPVLAASVLCAAVAGTPGAARAAIVLSAGLAGNANVGSNVVKLPASWSLTGMAGLRFEVGPIELTPELELTFHNSFDQLRAEKADRVFQAMVGGRAGLALGSVVPSAYVHFGAGNVHLMNSQNVERSETGPSVEVGGALDYRFAKVLALGVQVGYVDVSLSQLDADRRNIQWLRVGARASLSF